MVAVAVPLKVAVMVAEPPEEMVPAVAVKVAVVVVAATLTDAGTVRLPLLEDSATFAPPAGAALDNVTVQELVPLEARAVGLQAREEILEAPCRVMVAVAVPPVIEAVMVALPPEERVPVLALNEPVVPFGGMVMAPGTVRAALFDDRLTMVSPLEGPGKVTVQRLVPLEPRLVGEQLIDRFVPACRVMTAVGELPLSVAVMVALPLELMLPADAVNAAVVELAGTLTEPGTVKELLFDESAMLVADVREALLSVTVQDELELELSVVGEHCTEERFTGPCRLMMVVGDALFRTAVMVALPLVVRVPVDAVKLAVVELAATVTEAGTVTEALFDDRATVMVEAREAFDSVTLQEELALEARIAGAH